MEKVQLTTMCMITNEATNEVLVQERVKSWGGIAFPGGKIETGESVIKSVKREIIEETGLKISDLSFCGLKERKVCFNVKDRKRNKDFRNKH